MINKRQTLIYALGILHCFLFSVLLSASQPDSSKWICSWLLCGPFPLESVEETISDLEHLPGFETDFLQSHGGEKNVKVKSGQVEKYAGGTCRWFEHTSEDFTVDLDQAVSPADFVCAYAYHEIESPGDQVCLLALGTNDGGRLWLNGERIWDHPEGRALRPDNDILVVLLRKGTNRLLLKIEERGNKWGFCVRVLPFNSSLFAEHSRIFQVISRENGHAFLRFLQPGSTKKRIFKKAALSLCRFHEPEQSLWQQAWTKAREMPLKINPEIYENYLLKIEGILIDNTPWKIEIPFSAGKRKEYILFENGNTNYQIVIAGDASEAEKWAAKELQHWLKKISGAEFPVVTDKAAVRENEIIVGFNRHAQKIAGAQLKAPRAEDESFTYQNYGAKILITGGKERGTMYGVFTFLERELGCRWYTSRVSVIPERKRFVFDRLYRTESPGLQVRNDFYFEAFEPIWAARNKINGAMNVREQPGGVEGYWSVHTFYRFMPPDEFFPTHPEYYSLINGKRIHDRAQLCLTNPDVLQIITERLRQTMRDNPNYLIYSVSQNDWRNPCQCEKCQVLAKREESESGPLIWFVNRVAKQIEAEFPEKFVGTLAYQYTRKPCKNLRPRDNVVIRLCSIECCFAHDFHHCPENESFIADLTGWAAISPQLYIWDYVVNFSHYIMPYPNFRVLQSNVQTFRDNKAIGIMEQAAYQSRGGEFAELRAYVLAQLLWNPECDVDRVINDFMFGYYGRSGQYVRQYFDLLHHRLTAETHIHLGLTPEDKLFSAEFIREADAIFDLAETVAGNDELLHRVELARLPVMYLKCKRNPLEAKFDGTYARFCEIVAREGITHYAERGEPHRKAFHQKIESVK